MLTQEEDVEIHALAKRGWTISEIARHTGRDRKTIRAYLDGVRQPGVRARVEPDPFDRIEPYVRQRLSDDHGVWGTTLFDEVQELGYDRSYPTFTRKLRERQLRPHCEACSGVKGRATVIIDHPAGEEIQWDWDELGACPWDPSVDVFLLVGVLSHSSKARAWVTYSMDQPHLIEGIDQVLHRFGGTPRVWRTDRMATVINPTTGKLQASFTPVAKHYGVTVVPCPPRRGNRKGVVEKQIHYVTQRWWRTLDATNLADAQASLDRFCATTGDARRRTDTTVGELGATEPLLDLPAMAYPAEAPETPSAHNRVICPVRRASICADRGWADPL
jgi:transposase